jgi:hypothetical protein
MEIGLSTWVEVEWVLLILRLTWISESGLGDLLLLSVGSSRSLDIVRLSKEGEKGKERVLLAGGRDRHRVHLHFPRPAIGSLRLFHYHHAHASTKCIAVFGSFVKQYRGVLTNRKRRLLGRAAVSGRRPRLRDCDPSFFLTPSAENSCFMNE